MTEYLMGETFIMPDQDKAFNGDTFACEKFIELRDKFDVKLVVEFGSAVGGTTKWLGDNFPKVISTEINAMYRSVCLQRIKGRTNVISLFGNTLELLPQILKKCNDNTIFFIDDHWLSHCPLPDELRIIAASGLKPILVIHDFKVVGHPEFGYDTYNGQTYEWGWIKESIEKIYGIDGYEVSYNTHATGAMRGIIFIQPK